MKRVQLWSASIHHINIDMFLLNYYYIMSTTTKEYIYILVSLACTSIECFYCCCWRCTCVRLLMSTSLNNRKNNLKWFLLFVYKCISPYDECTYHIAAVFCARLSSFCVYYQWYQHMYQCWCNLNNKKLCFRATLQIGLKTHEITVSNPIILWIKRNTCDRI